MRGPRITLGDLARALVPLLARWAPLVGVVLLATPARALVDPHGAWTLGVYSGLGAAVLVRRGVCDRRSSPSALVICFAAAVAPSPS